MCLQKTKQSQLGNDAALSVYDYYLHRFLSVAWLINHFSTSGPVSRSFDPDDFVDPENEEQKKNKKIKKN